MLLATTQFALTSDEFAFLAAVVAALIVVVGPLYLSAFLQGRRSKSTAHELGHNGGVDQPNPTVKDFAAGAYRAAARAELIAEQTRADGSNTNRKLTDHIRDSDDQREELLAHLQRLDGRADEADGRLDEAGH